MGDAITEIGAWAYVVYPSIVAVAGSIVAAVGYLTKRLCKGATYYAGKMWDLLERAANRHFEFIERLSEEQTKQTTSLQKIEASTEATKNVLSKMGSDPTKFLVALKDEMVDSIVEQLHERGVKCSNEEIESMLRRQQARGKGKKQDGNDPP